MKHSKLYNLHHHHQRCMEQNKIKSTTLLFINFFRHFFFVSIHCGLSGIFQEYCVSLPCHKFLRDRCLHCSVHTSRFFLVSRSVRSQRKLWNMLCSVPHHTVNQVRQCGACENKILLQSVLFPFVLPFFLPSFFLWVDGWIGAAIFHIQIRILFHFPVCVFFCTFLDHFVCFLFYFLFIWFCNYFWRPTLRMWKEKIHMLSINFIWFAMHTHTHIHAPIHARARFVP